MEATNAAAEPDADKKSPLFDKFVGFENTMQMDCPEPLEDEYREVAWGIPRYGEKFQPIWINRPNCQDYDVKFEMKYCGICHSDCHIGLNDLSGCMYPIVPGHELCGTVVEVGPKVTKVQVGDNVAVGCIMDSCLECGTCADGHEQYCEKGGNTHTYNAMKTYGHISGNPDVQTFGGYSGSNVVHEHFIVKVPDGLPLEKVGPIMCAGITLFDPLVHWGALNSEKQMCIGIVGVGGLGTMGIKLAKAMGHRVVAISNSPNKAQLAAEKGADSFVVATDPDSMKAEAGKIDLILNTAAAAHQLGHYLSLVRNNGTIVQLGLLTEKHQVNQVALIRGRKTIAGSLIGGIRNTELLLTFCAEKNIAPDTQLIEASKLDWAWEQLVHNSNAGGVRYVIDIQKSLQDAAFLPAAQESS